MLQSQINIDLQEKRYRKITALGNSLIQTL